MKRTLPKLILLLIIVVLSVTDLIAAPEDYGRDYILRDGNQITAFLSILFWSGLLLCLIFLLLRSGYYKMKNNIEKKDEQKNKNKKHMQYYPSIIPCPDCMGRGWIKGDEISFYELPICSHCNGFGKVLTQEIHELVKKAKDEDRCNEERKKIEKIEQDKIEMEERAKYQNKKRRIGDFEYTITTLLNMDYKTFDEIYMKSLNECSNIILEYQEKMKENACTHCEGSNKSCTYCQGKGYILTKEMIGLTERIRITRREHIDFFKGYSLFGRGRDKLKTGISYNYSTNSFRELLYKKLEKAPECPYCKGIGKIMRSDIVRISKYENGNNPANDSYFIKEICKKCNGTGFLRDN